MKKYKKLIIIGAGGHGSVIADIARLSGYDEILFLDDAEVKRSDSYRVIGKVENHIQHLPNSDFVIAVGNNRLRFELSKKLTGNGAKIVSLIHPSAIIGENVTIGEGTVIMAGVVVNPGTTIGDGVILNTCCSLDHDCMVGSFSHISVGTHLCGTVSVGTNVFIGAGATVVNNVSVCDDAIIGAGAVVLKNIESSGTYVGVPARKIRK